MKNPAQTRKHWIILLFDAMMMGSSLGLLTNGNRVFYAPMERSLGIARGQFHFIQPLYHLLQLLPL